MILDFFKLIRYRNLLMIALMQFLFRYTFLIWQNVPLALNDFQYVLLVLSTILIAAGGYVINDIFDQSTDAENKPHKVFIGNAFTESAGYNIYVALTTSGVALGFYLANAINKPSFATLFILIAATLYLYASNLKQNLLIGNFIIATLLSLSVVIIGVFELYPVTTPDNQPQMRVLFSIMIDYAVFAFVVNLIREIVKDLEDVNGDYNQGMNTLPIAIGVKRTAQVVFVLSFVPIGMILYYINEYFMTNNLWISAGYTLITVVAPLIYCTIKMWSAQKKKEFNHLSSVLKLVLLFGILSIAVVTYNIHHHA
jgi:4-hydroxybenzoate polyprenyltransferase